MNRSFPFIIAVLSLFAANLDAEPPTTPRLAQLDALIAAEPENAAAIQDRAYALALLGAKPEAVADLKRAEALAPQNERVLTRIGWAYFNLKEFQLALDHWLEAARLSRYDRYYDYYTVALGYWGIGEGAKAAAFYQTAVGQDESLGDWKTLVPRTESWTWMEKNAIYGLFDAWRTGYRTKPEAAR